MPVYLVSLALGLSSYCLRRVQVACSYRCRSCSSHPLPALFFLAKTSASRVLTVSSAPDSERAITFGSFSLLSIALRPRLLLSKLAKWRGGSGAWLPFSFSLFLWGRRHSEDTEKGAGMGLPIGLFLFQLEGLPCLHTGGSGRWMESLAGMSILRDGYLVLFRDSSLPLLRSPVSFTTFRVCLPRAPALRQVLEAVLAEGALESPSVLVLAFQLSLPSGEVV